MSRPQAVGNGHCSGTDPLFCWAKANSGAALLALATELDEAEDRSPDDTSRRDEGEPVRQGDKAEINHVQGCPYRGHRQSILYEIGFVVLPSDSDEVAPILAGGLQLFACAHASTADAQHIPDCILRSQVTLCRSHDRCNLDSFIKWIQASWVTWKTGLRGGLRDQLLPWIDAKQGSRGTGKWRAGPCKLSWTLLSFQRCRRAQGTRCGRTGSLASNHTAHPMP